MWNFIQLFAAEIITFDYRMLPHTLLVLLYNSQYVHNISFPKKGTCKIDPQNIGRRGLEVSELVWSWGNCPDLSPDPNFWPHRTVILLFLAFCCWPWSWASSSFTGSWRPEIMQKKILCVYVYLYVCVHVYICLCVCTCVCVCVSHTDNSVGIARGKGGENR